MIVGVTEPRQEKTYYKDGATTGWTSVTLLSTKVILFVSSTTLPIEHEAQILPDNIVVVVVCLFILYALLLEYDRT